ncbi:MAG TPA: NADP-dependent oxidoreductase [Actinophytocola sp.]|nr:NADP-dependent oxidoreductase [Actinophytocola sp.]
MKAVQFAEYGGPEVLKVVEVDEPHAGPGQVRVAVRAAGVNGIDWKIRAGYLSKMRPIPLPAGTGIDAAGIVDEVGDGVTGVTVGDAVFGSGEATYAEYATLSHWAAMPAGLSFEAAAGAPIPVETAIRILDQLNVQSGQTLVVNGAAGGVGTATVQIARQRDIEVIGIAGRSSQDYLRSFGVVPTTYGEGLADRVRALAPHGVDAALDIAGSGVIPELIELTGDPARVLSIGDLGATEHGAQISMAANDRAAAYAEAARLFADGALRIPVAKAFRLDEAADAQRASAAGHVAGRTVITVA